VVWTTGPVDGAMGIRAATLRVTNCGRAPYTVSGYPDVGVLDEDGDRVPVDVTHGFPPGDPIADATPTTITLEPGEAAEAALLWRQLVEANGTDSVTGPLVVHPAPDGGPQRTGLDVDLGTTRKVTVGAWRPATG
jgi:hypothetical protein